MNRLARTLELLAAALDRLTIPYAIVGSVASSARGSYRATEDIDLLAQISPEHAEGLAQTLGRDWYADGQQMRSAIGAGRAFNLIYLPLSQKVDVFPVVDEFCAAELERADTIPVPTTEADYPVLSAEDVVLAKLQWYKAGGEISDRHWNDIGNVIRITPGIDWVYMEGWAPRLGIAALLARAKSER